jgi:hypothetical protein
VISIIVLLFAFHSVVALPWLLLTSMGRLLRLPGIPYLLAQPRKLLKDHMRRLTVQEHEADHAILKAVTSDVSLPLEQRLQVGCTLCMAVAKSSPSVLNSINVSTLATCRRSDCLRLLYQGMQVQHV